jgi:hypothetical protein
LVILRSLRLGALLLQLPRKQNEKMLFHEVAGIVDDPDVREVPLLQTFEPQERDARITERH